jgi:LmbE family N-acetylglucosaminyl deacetylase/CheY-like chemotaxis protein
MPVPTPTPTRILLIEDNVEFAHMLASWLKTIPDLEFVQAPDGDTGQQFAKAGSWDLVITDMELPGVQGADLLPLIRLAAPWTQVLVITAAQRLEYAVHAVQHADLMLLKPFKREVFLDGVHKLLHESAAKKQRRRRCVLAIGAHPDDVEIGCSGTLARFAAEGAQIIALTLSRGAFGGQADDRVQEAQAAATVLGASCIVADLPDRQISSAHPTIGVIEDILKQHEITHVYTHSANDMHQDHRSVHAASLVACRNVANVFCYQSPSTTVAFAPTVFTEIKPFMAVKLAAIAAHDSQASNRVYLDPEHIRATAIYWGRFCGYGMAEPFEAIRASH